MRTTPTTNLELRIGHAIASSRGVGNQSSVRREDLEKTSASAHVTRGRRGTGVEVRKENMRTIRLDLIVLSLIIIIIIISTTNRRVCCRNLRNVLSSRHLLRDFGDVYGTFALAMRAFERGRIDERTTKNQPLYSPTRIARRSFVSSRRNSRFETERFCSETTCRRRGRPTETRRLSSTEDGDILYNYFFLKRS